MRKHKFFIVVVSALLLLIVALSLSASRIIAAVAKQQLEKTFSGSMVSIGKCRFNPMRSLMFSDIEIKREGSYDFRIKEVNIYYSIPYAIFRIREVAFNIAIATLKTKGVSFEDAHATGTFDGARGSLYIKKIKYNDAVIRDVQGTVRIDRGVLFLDSLTARLFNGGLSGNFKAEIDKNGEFSTVLTSAGLNLGTFVEDFKLGDKFQITGKLNGSISLSGRGFGITDIRGEFSTDASGGTLVIKDTRFLENMARKSGQSLNILVENFEHYEYNLGIMKVSLDEGDLMLDIALDGEAGRRTFDVILHDIIAKKRGAL